MINLVPQNQPMYKKIDNYVFNFEDKLGQGNFSKVYRGINEITKQTVAIKVIQLNSLKSKKLQQLLFSQIDVLKKLSHPNILKCYEVFTSNRNCYIITQICNGGDLETKLRKHHHFSQQQAEPYILDIFKGLRYLAENHVIHRDIKVANIFLHNGIAKIADFGFAKFTKDNFKDINIGSPIYMSPEGFIENIYGPKTDVWAFGIFIYELVHGKTPFSHCVNQVDLRRQIRTPISYSSLKPQLSFELKDIIIKCLQISQQKRITVAQLEQIPYFKRLLKLDAISLGGRKHNLLSSNQPNHQIKALTPSHGNTYTSFRNGTDSLGHSLQKNKYGIKNFYNNFQPQGNSIKFQQRGVVSTNNIKAVNNYISSNSNPNSSPFRNNLNGLSGNIRQNSTEKDRKLNFMNLNAKEMGTPGSFNANLNHIIREEVPRKPRIDSTYITVKTNHMQALPGILSFREAVNSLHYCRLIYKFIMTSRELDQVDHKLITSLSILMFKILGQISSKIDKKQISYDQQTTRKQTKLREVSNEYFRKYSVDIERPLSRQISYQSIVQQVKQKIQQYESLFLQKKGNSSSSSSFIHLLHFLAVIAESTEILRKCASEGRFMQWSEYKFIQEFLSKSKNTMSYQSYLDIKNKVKF